MTVETVGIGLLLSLIGDLSEGELLLELSAKQSIGSDQLLASIDQSLARSDGAVGLDTEQNLWNVRVRN
jgi:hypothetical protein